jgi:hypothetical protein
MGETEPILSAGRATVLAPLNAVGHIPHWVLRWSFH